MRGFMLCDKCKMYSFSFKFRRRTSNLKEFACKSLEARKQGKIVSCKNVIENSYNNVYPMSSEKECLYVCSRGILKSCDIYDPSPESSISHVTEYINAAYVANEAVSIYVASTALKNFIDNHLPNIHAPIVLVTGDCDLSVPYDIFRNRHALDAFLNNPQILKWYSQNCTVVDHPKLVQMPIGLDYHTISSTHHSWGRMMTPIEQEALLMRISEEATPRSSRLCKAYCNFQFNLHHSRFGYDRSDAINSFPSSLAFYQECPTNREYTWRTQANYAFVVSPHGNGLDCHRTWEAICLGCIPIMKTSALDPMFEGLPVLIVNSWSDVSNELLEETLAKWKWNETAFSMKKLHLSFWVEQIQRSKHSVSAIEPSATM